MSANRIIVDVDGVIAAKTTDGDYANAAPLPYGIAQINALYDRGFEIYLFTARYGDRENGNLTKMYQRGYVELVDWLAKNNVKYHVVQLGKPAGALYIDDKAARVESDTPGGWDQVWEEVEQLHKKDKYGNVIK